MIDAAVKLSGVSRIRLYINEDKLPLREIVAREKPDLACTGVFYTGAWKPTCHLKADGAVLADDPAYRSPGLVWDVGPDLHAETVPAPGARNYLSCCLLIHNGQPEPKLYYNADVGGKRGRVAVWLRSGELGVTAFPDGGEAMTPEDLRDYLAREIGPDTAIMMDGGGKVNFYDAASGTMLQGREPSQNLILVYRKKKEESPMDNEAKTVCLDPGHGPGTVNGSPDGTYKEREFAWDMYERIAPLLEGQGVKVVCTRAEDAKPSLTARAEVSNAAKADCFVSLHSNAFGSGWTSATGLEVYTSSGPMTAQRNLLATALVNQFHAAGVRLRQEPIKHNLELTVLAKTDAPAVLIEYGFHTNEEDVSLLKNSAYRDNLALATAKGVCDWLGVAWSVGMDAEATPEDTPDSWAAEAWALAYYKGILDGTRPRDPVTRQELAVVLERTGLLD